MDERTSRCVHGRDQKRKWVNMQKQKKMWDALWVVIGLPLQYFYRTGPTVLGGWQGMNNADICAKLTKVPSEFGKRTQGNVSLW